MGILRIQLFMKANVNRAFQKMFTKMRRLHPYDILKAPCPLPHYKSLFSKRFKIKLFKKYP